MAFSLLFISGAVLFGELLGSFGDSDATFERYFANTSSRATNLVGAVLLGVAAAVFLWFLVQLVRRLLPDDGQLEFLPLISLAFGLVFVVLVVSAAAALVTVPFTLVFGGLYDTELVLESGKALLPQFGFVLLVIYAMWAAAVVVATTTVSARRSEMLPRWMCRLGFVTAGVLVLSGPSGVGLFALPVWVVVISVYWFRLASRTR